MHFDKDFTQIPNVIFRCQKLSPKHIGLYAYLNFINHTGNSLPYRPSQIQIMKALSIGSRSTFKKILDELILYGFIGYTKGDNLITRNSTYKILTPSFNK